MSRFINPWEQFLDPGGKPYAGGTVTFGMPNVNTQGNPKPPYSDKDYIGALSPIQTLNPHGSFATALFLRGKYSMELRDSLGNLIRSDPEVQGANTSGSIISHKSIADAIADADLTVNDTVYTASYNQATTPAKRSLGGARYIVVSKVDHDTIRGTGTVGNGDHTISATGDVLLMSPETYPLATMFGCIPDTDTDQGAASQRAVNFAIRENVPLFYGQGIYRFDTQAAVNDNFEGLTLYGFGAHMDFRVNNLFQFGDHTLNGSNEYTQTVTTAKKIHIEGFIFKPEINGYNPTTRRFAYASPLSLSSVEEVSITHNQFRDWDFAAVDLNAPSKQVRVSENVFIESQESSVSYGVRPFAQVAGAPLDNLDETTGTLAYAAPSFFHEDITVTNNYFELCSHNILSWNVRHFHYQDNFFKHPVVRGISISNWNFSGIISGNIYSIIDNQLVAPTIELSTGINIGVGTENITIDDERFRGVLSGTSPNDLFRPIVMGGVNRGIKIGSGCKFDVLNTAHDIVADFNVGFSVFGALFNHPHTGGPLATILINALPPPSPGYNEPRVQIENCTDNGSNRFINLGGDPAGTQEAFIVKANTTTVAQLNGFISSSPSTTPWQVHAESNSFAFGTATYSAEFGLPVSFVCQDGIKREFRLDTGGGQMGGQTTADSYTVPAVPEIFGSFDVNWSVYSADDPATGLFQDHTFVITDLTRTSFGGDITRNAGAGFNEGFVAVRYNFRAKNKP